MTRYYVNMAPSIVKMLQDPESEVPAPKGWRLVERFGPRFEVQECWLVEDDGAGEEFEGFLVMPAFTMSLTNPDDPDDNSYVVTVTEREIVKAP